MTRKARPRVDKIERFKIALADPRVLVTNIKILSGLLNEGKFKFTKDKIELIEMDCANVALAHLELMSSGFTEYRVDKETKIALNLSTLSDVLNKATNDDMIVLEYNETNNKQLFITLRGVELDRKYTIPVIELDDSETKIPSLTQGVAFKVNTKALGKAIKELDTVSETAKFMFDGKFKLEAKGDLSKLEIPFREIDVKRKGEAICKYSIEYLKKMLIVCKDFIDITEDVYITYNNDFPIEIEYVSSDRFRLYFILAPRVSND